MENTNMKGLISKIKGILLFRTKIASVDQGSVIPKKPAWDDRCFAFPWVKLIDANENKYSWMEQTFVPDVIYEEGRVRHYTYHDMKSDAVFKAIEASARENEAFRPNCVYVPRDKFERLGNNTAITTYVPMRMPDEIKCEELLLKYG